MKKALFLSSIAAMMAISASGYSVSTVEKIAVADFNSLDRNSFDFIGRIDTSADERMKLLTLDAGITSFDSFDDSTFSLIAKDKESGKITMFHRLTTGLDTTLATSKSVVFSPSGIGSYMVWMDPLESRSSAVATLHSDGTQMSLKDDSGSIFSLHEPIEKDYKIVVATHEFNPVNSTIAAFETKTLAASA